MNDVTSIKAEKNAVNGSALHAEQKKIISKNVLKKQQLFFMVAIRSMLQNQPME